MVVTDASGVTIGEQKYFPYGETRVSTGTIYTDKLFTGQREITGLGIYDFHARMYDPKLGRFLSADSIVPGAANPQAYNRYSYTLGNPLRYTDPTGHKITECASQYEPACGSVNGGPVGNPYPGNGGGNKPKLGKGGGGHGGADAGGDAVLGGGGNTNGGVTCGQQGVYSSACPGWHDYHVENVVCPWIFHCTKAEMIDYMSRFAYPNQDPSQPAENLHQYTVGIPIIEYDLRQWGPVVFSTGNGGLTTTNTTLPPHILYDGKVERTASQNVNGDWVVVTEGWGNNRIPGMDVANKVGGPILFNTVDTQMYLYIVTDQLFRP